MSGFKAGEGSAEELMYNSAEYRCVYVLNVGLVAKIFSGVVGVWIIFFNEVIDRVSESWACDAGRWVMGKAKLQGRRHKIMRGKGVQRKFPELVVDVHRKIIIMLIMWTYRISYIMYR